MKKSKVQKPYKPLRGETAVLVSVNGETWFRFVKYKSVQAAFEIAYEMGFRNFEITWSQNGKNFK